MSSETDWASLGEWVVALRQLHDRARQGKLPDPELRRYLEERDTLAKAVLAAQRLRASPGARGRQTLRVALERRVEMTVNRAALDLRTQDLGLGGFAVLMPSAMRAGQAAPFTLELEKKVEVSGKARVVSLQRKGRLYRVAFRFEELSSEDQDRVALTVFDAVLAGIDPERAT